jgi:hypothetical protein
MGEYRELGDDEIVDRVKGDQYWNLRSGTWALTNYEAADKHTPSKDGNVVPYRRPLTYEELEQQLPVKDSNPKDVIGSTKPPIHNIPRSVISEVGMALAEGEYKYGGYNWRAIGVRASVYMDAVDRHLTAWWEGEDVDPDSGLNHITKAISALMVLRDGMIQQNWNDDRPPKSLMDRKALETQFKGMLDRLKSLQPEPAKGYTEKGQE